MKTTLFIELNELNARLMVYNEVDQVCHYLDITGGYGKRSIPLCIHYLKDNEILIGEDALFYDEEENSIFIDSILNEKDQVIIDFISVVFNKSSDLIPGLKIKQCVLISNHPHILTEEFKECCNLSLKEKKLTILTYEQAIAGFYMYQYKLNLMKDETTISCVYVDYKKIFFYQLSLSYNLEQQIKQVQVESQHMNLDLLAIHEFYVHSLRKLHQSEKLNVSQHQLRQLYQNQIATLHKQFIVPKNVNVYSSVFFPPKKIIISYEDFQLFLAKWKVEYEKEKNHELLKHIQETECIYSSGGYDLFHFISKIEDFQFCLLQSTDYMLLNGAFTYVENQLKGIEIMKLNTLKFAIGVFNEQEFYPLIQENEVFSTTYDLDLILTDYQNEIFLYSRFEHDIKPIHKVKIKILKKIQRISLHISINKDKEIEEVSYELRNI